MMKLLPILILAVISGCSPDRRSSLPEWEWDSPTTAPSDSSDAPADSTFVPSADSVALSGYPEGMHVWSFTDPLEDGYVAKGFIAEIDFDANPSLQFNALHSATVKTPTDFHSSANDAGLGVPLITTNAGYFWAGESLSLLIHDGDVKSIASNYAWVTVDGKTTTVYPVRAAFGQHPDGSFEATWIYCCMDDESRPYSFPSPLENNEETNEYMRSAPTSDTEGAELWTPAEAVGGGPMIVYEGQNVADIYYWKEVLDEGGTAGFSHQPRTAIAVTESGTMLLLVCDGRGCNGSDGFTLSELADKLISLGAVFAINLDGGGSSTIVGKDGVVLNRPSDSGEDGDIIQREIPTAIVITKL